LRVPIPTNTTIRDAQSTAGGSDGEELPNVTLRHRPFHVSWSLTTVAVATRTPED
jgi:hypothetical protein